MTQKKTFRIYLLETLSPITQSFRRFILRLSGYKNIHHSVILERNLNLDRVDPQGITIKKNCLIASGVTILCHEHVYRDLVDKKLPLLKPVEIGARTFIGVGATILPGVTIGDDCIIGAGATVVKDIPHGSLAVGVPAKIIRSGLIMDNKAVLKNVNEGTLPAENAS